MGQKGKIKFFIFVSRYQYHMWKILFCLFGGMLIYVIPVTSQPKPPSTPDDKPLRVEFKVRSDNETYRVIPCGASGVLLFYKSLETVENSKTKWYFTLYDKNLQQLWVKSLPVINEMEYKLCSIRSDTLALLFQVPGKDKGLDYNFLIARVVLSKGNFIANTGKFPENSYIDQFDIIRQKAFIALNVKDEPARIMMADLSSGVASTISLSEKAVSTVTSFYVDSANFQIMATIKKEWPKNKIECWLVNYDTTGKPLSQVQISTITDDRYLQDVEFITLNQNEILLFGSYGTSSGKRESSPTKPQGESTGLFYSKVSGNQQKSIEFFNFLELKNAKSLLDEKEIAMIKKKALKKNRDLRDYSIDFKLLFHPVTREKDEFILFSEVYHPQYHSENFTDFDFYGQPFTNSYTVFDGYRFTNAIITAFDKDGNLLWDNNMEIRNLISFELTPKVNSYRAGGNVVLMYLSDGKIASKIIHGDKTVENVDYSTFDLTYPDDKLLSETKSRIAYWYGNYFLCYGYEDIKNVALDGNNKRLVYYFSKIKYE
jgi:hypothetical protein